jgi:hypothetical protein
MACPVARRGTEAPRPTLPPKSPATTGRGSRLLSVRPKAGAVLIGTLSKTEQRRRAGHDWLRTPDASARGIRCGLSSPRAGAV